MRAGGAQVWCCRLAWVADSLIKHVNLNSKIKASNTNKNTWNSINKFSEDEVANNISILKEEPIVIEDTDSNSI